MGGQQVAGIVCVILMCMGWRVMLEILFDFPFVFAILVLIPGLLLRR